MMLSSSFPVLPEDSPAVSLDAAHTQCQEQDASTTASSLPISGYTQKAEVALRQLATWLQASHYRFTTVTPATHARINARPENIQAQSLTGIFGWSRPFTRILLPAEIFDPLREAGIVVAQGLLWRSQVRVSSLDGLLLFHSAYPTEAADAVFFGPDTYRFVNALKRHLQGKEASVRRAVDIGCGAGPGVLTLARLCPQAEILGVDINPTALALTRLNAELAGLDQVQPYLSDLLLQVEGSFDLIVANPPYLVDATQRAYRHGGGPLGAELSLDIVNAALERLAPGGSLVLYTGAAIVDNQDPFRQQVAQLLDTQQVAWEYEEVDPDVFGEELLHLSYANAERIAAVVLTLTRLV